MVQTGGGMATQYSAAAANAFAQQQQQQQQQNGGNNGPANGNPGDPHPHPVTVKPGVEMKVGSPVLDGGSNPGGGGGGNQPVQQTNGIVVSMANGENGQQNVVSSLIRRSLRWILFLFLVISGRRRNGS